MINPFLVRKGIPVLLAGSPHERGRQQAARCPDMVATIRHAVARRLEESRDCLSAPGVRSYMEELRHFHRKQDPETMEEIEGIGTGFGIPGERLFDYLMLSLVENYNRTGNEIEECTAFASSAKGGGVILAKNRDYRHDHIAIQRVFRHRDPEWGGREALCVGSLGSPGNFSSGVNSEGFAVADTASRTKSNRVGRHRFFLLTRLQSRCATVAEALSEIAAMPHAGGGTLILGDATGCMAAVELGAGSVTVEIRHEGWLGRTNHYVGSSTAELNQNGHIAAGSHQNSERRLTTLRTLLSSEPERMRIETAAGVLSYRGQNDGEALCRKGGKNLPETISGCIYSTGQRRLWFANGNPSSGDWSTFSFDVGSG